ncbi:MAG: polysulfide reductase NrfD [Acidimicrobiia bacterium]|nr:polysulfide reductase NrfD [Acidimicrobiia bacterium]
MSVDAVTVDGVEGARSGRHAAPEQVARRRRGGGREQRMVPDAEPVSYYGQPVLNRPTWKSRDIAGYFFVGGLAGASSIFGAAAQASGRPGTARVAKLGALGGVTLSAAALVHDLGRPSRFYNMLRVFKPTSPMSVGSWILSGFGPAAGVAALSDLTGRAPRIGAAATASAAVLGSAVATYTAVLVTDTAVPAWHDGHKLMPVVFGASAASSAAGLALVAAPSGESGPARQVAAVASLVEELSLEAMTRSMSDEVGHAYHEGRAGKLLRAAKACTAFGAVAAAVAGHRRPVGVAAGLALLTGSALTRFGVFHAGLASADDPQATTGPQRARLAT